MFTVALICEFVTCIWILDFAFPKKKVKPSPCHSGKAVFDFSTATTVHTAGG